jgi:acetyl/propionyl-CoA carboxylase alpha subunit
MLAKLIVHGATRAEAIDRLRAALDATTVLGVRTNLRFLRWLLDQPAMRDGEMRTDTIAGLDVPGPPAIDERHWSAAARLLHPLGPGPWDDGWRLNAPSVCRVRHDVEERSVAVDGDAHELPVAVRAGAAVHVDVDGQSLDFGLAPTPSVDEALQHAAGHAGAGSTALAAPMPGRVIAVRAAAGDHVEAHQTVVVIEAMKMEHAVTAPVSGRLVRLLVAEGQQVQRGELLGEVAQSDP